MLVMAGCKTCPDVVPEKVYITVEKIVTVPDELTKPCNEVTKRDNSYGEAVRLANARKASNEECSGRMKQIRGLGQ